MRYSLTVTETSLLLRLAGAKGSPMARSRHADLGAPTG
jgi:hypothetical protein